MDERSEAPSVGIERNIVVDEEIVELETIRFLEHPFEKLPGYFEPDRMFEQVGNLVLMGELQHVEAKLSFEMRRRCIRVGCAGAEFFADLRINDRQREVGRFRMPDRVGLVV